LDAWVAVLTHYDLLNPNKLPSVLNKPEIKKALNVMEEMTMTSLEREQYDAHLDFLRMEKEAFEARYIKGKAEGKAEGLAEGKAKGLAEGLAAGEAKGRLQIARTMLKSGVAVATIAQYTGLHEDDIVA